MSGPLGFGAGGGGGDAVREVIAGSGITTSGTATSITVVNDGVRSLSGSGISVSSATGAVTITAPTVSGGTGISVSGSGTTALTVSATGVNSVTAGTGISVSGTTALTVSATGVQSISAGNGISVSGTTTPTITASIAAGTGISISGTTTLSVSATGVQSLTAGTGISVSGTTTPTVTNSGVTSIVAGTGITVSGATGAVTVSSSGGSGVTSVTGTAPIVSSGGTTPAISLDSTAALTQSNIITGTALKSSGLTGATAASRYVGATASGAPASGTFLLGDFVIDQTGKVYVCTTAGTPGTWTQVGASSGSAVTLIQRQTLSAAATAVSFTSIPQTYELLQIVIYSPANAAITDSTVKWNSVTGYNSWRVGVLRPAGSATGSVDTSTSTGWSQPYISLGGYGGSGTGGASWFQQIYFPRYSKTEAKAVTGILTYGSITGATPDDVFNSFTGGSALNTAAITSITLTRVRADYIVGTTFSLYGWS